MWPPLTVKSDAELVAPSGFTGKLTSVKRDDGSLQAAVNGWPVYGWAFDRKPGDLNGQSNNEAWWVLSPAGDVIRSAPTVRFRSNKLGTTTVSIATEQQNACAEKALADQFRAPHKHQGTHNSPN